MLKWLKTYFVCLSNHYSIWIEHVAQSFVFFKVNKSCEFSGKQRSLSVRFLFLRCVEPQNSPHLIKRPQDDTRDCQLKWGPLTSAFPSLSDNFCLQSNPTRWDKWMVELRFFILVTFSDHDAWAAHPSSSNAVQWNAKKEGRGQMELA